MRLHLCAFLDNILVHMKLCLVLAFHVTNGLFVEREIIMTLVDFSANIEGVSSSIKCGAICQARESCEAFHFHELEQNCTLGTISDLALVTKTSGNVNLRLKFQVTRSVENGKK